MQLKMKLALYTITAILSGAHAVGAFVPQSKLLELKQTFEEFTKRTSESSLLKSSLAEPQPDQESKPVLSKFATSAVYKKWGVDNANEEEYWYDSRIHTLGNRGFFGAVSRLTSSTFQIDSSIPR